MTSNAPSSPLPTTKPKPRRDAVRSRVIRFIAVATAITAFPTTAVLFKFAAQASSQSLAAYLAYFVPGLLFGLFYSTGTTLALRHTYGNPNIVFAVIAALGTVALYVTLGLTFRHSIEWHEYLGMVLIVGGTAVLLIKPRPTPKQDDLCSESAN